MNTVVQIRRVDLVNNWKETHPPVIIKSMIFNDKDSAEKFVDEFGIQHSANYMSTYRAKIIPTSAPRRYAVLYRVIFEYGEYRLYDEIVDRDSLNPAQLRAFEGNGAYSMSKEGEVRELEAGIITKGEWWTSYAYLDEDFNNKLRISNSR